jgi:hypothetical protein
MQLGEYIFQRIDEGQANAVIEGLQNDVYTNLDQAIKYIPAEDWRSEISDRQKESDAQTLIWLSGRSDPSYSIQE